MSVLKAMRNQPQVTVSLTKLARKQLKTTIQTMKEGSRLLVWTKLLGIVQVHRLRDKKDELC